jgi:dTDP-N-acetylfucosamine:lipid II N-acetylfucosaminyltransferase
MQSNPENCHIFNLDKFIPGFLDFLAENIGLENNSFYIWGPERYAFGLKSTYPINWVNDSQGVASLVMAMKNSKRIFLHGLFVRQGIEILFQERAVLKKCFWLCWGGDLYCYRQPLKTMPKRLLEAKRRVVLANMGYFLSGVYGDFELCKQVYRTTAKYLKAYVYPSNFGHEKYSPSRYDGKRKLKVLVGNSATPENQHRMAFDLLKKNKDRLLIYCPLTYGNDDYRKEVIENGSAIFGDDFIPITEHMPWDDYKRFLSTLDIGFFTNNRQQGMGNITHLLGLGKQVYAPQGLTHIKHLTQLGLVIHDSQKFLTTIMPESVAESNHSIMAKHFSFENLKGELLYLLNYEG